MSTNKVKDVFGISGFDLTVAERERIVKRAEEMLYELESNYLEVVLIPAEEQKHSGHSIRAVQYANCEWYRDFAAGTAKPAPIKVRPRIKRSMIVRALNHIVNGTVPRPCNQAKSNWAGKLIEYIVDEFAAADRKAAAANELTDDDWSDCPF